MLYIGTHIVHALVHSTTLSFSAFTLPSFQATVTTPPHLFIISFFRLHSLMSDLLTSPCTQYVPVVSFTYSSLFLLFFPSLSFFPPYISPPSLPSPISSLHYRMCSIFISTLRPPTLSFLPPFLPMFFLFDSSPLSHVANIMRKPS